MNKTKIKQNQKIKNKKNWKIWEGGVDFISNLYQGWHECRLFFRKSVAHVLALIVKIFVLRNWSTRL